MIIDRQYLKRSLSTQTGEFEYVASLSVDNTTGQVNFGFSGYDNVLNFNIKSGKVLDYEGNFVYGLSPNETINLSGKCNVTEHNYYINGEPLNLNATKETGDVDWFYINSVDCSTNLDLYINGEKPNFEFSNLIFNGQGLTGYGTIENISGDGKKLKIFSGQFLSGDYKFISFPTNDITGTQQYSVIKTNATGENQILTGETISDVPYKLYTNFGILDSNFDINTVNLYTQNLSLEGQGYIFETGTTSLFLNYENLLGGIEVSDSGFPLNITFRNISGLGETASGIITGVAENDSDKNITVSGVLNGSGEMTGAFSINSTGLDAFLNQNASGIATGIKVTEIQYITGNFNENIFIPFTGIGTGTLLSGMAGSGFVNNITISGNVIGFGEISSDAFVFNGSGISGENINVIGLIPSGILTKEIYQTGNLTGYINGYFTGLATGTVFDFVNLYSVNATGQGFFEGPVTGESSISGIVTGFGTGIWDGAELQNSYETEFVTVGALVTGVTGYAHKQILIDIQGDHTGAPMIFVGFLTQNKDQISGEVIESGLSFTSSLMPYPGTHTGSGIFEGFFTKDSSSDPSYWDNTLRNVFETGLYTGGFSGTWTGYWEETFSGFGVGDITGEGYTGLGLTWVSGITTGNLFDNLDLGSGVIKYESSPNNFMRLSGALLDKENYLGSSGNPIIISGNTGVILASNYFAPKITGLSPPSLNSSYRDRPVWFEYECPGSGSDASVTFGLDRYKRFRNDGIEVGVNQGQRSPGHAIYIYKTGTDGELIFYRSFQTSSEGTRGTEYASNDLKTGEKIRVLFSLYNGDTGHDGIFQLSWKDGFRDTSQSSSYLFDNPIKQINYIEPNETGYTKIDNFTNYNWDSSRPTGFLSSFLVKNYLPQFKFVSGEFSGYDVLFTGQGLLSVSGDVLSENGESGIEGFEESSDALQNYQIAATRQVSGRQYENYSYSSQLDTFDNFVLVLKTGNVQYSRDQETDYHRLGRTLINGVDYGDAASFVNAANGEWNKYNINFDLSQNGNTILLTGFFPAWSSKLYSYRQTSRDTFSEIYSDTIIQNEDSQLDLSNTLYSGSYAAVLQASGNFIGIGNVILADMNISGVTGYLYVTGNENVYFDVNINDGSGSFLVGQSGITGSLSDFSGFFPYENGSYIPISNFTGIFEKTIQKSGYIEKIESGIASGLLDNPTGYLKFTGLLKTESQIFSINDGSGYFTFVGNFSGDASGYSIYETGQENLISGTGTYFKYNTTEKYSPAPFLFIKPYSGDLTGYFDNENYLKTFTGEWGITTGDISGGFEIDFLDNNLYNINNTGYTNTGQNFSVTGKNVIRILIERKQNYGFDLNELEISGHNTGIILQISGGI